MIIIATHNSQINLDRLLTSFAAHGTDGDDVCIVVSNDSTEEYKEYVHAARPHGYRIKHLCEPWAGFETGAFIYAFQQLKTTTEFLFLQDSMEVTGPGWLNQFRTRMISGPCVVPWITFAPYLLGCTPQVAQIITDTYGMFKEPGFGIFGGVHYTTRETLEIVERAGYMEFIPKTKADSEATERFLALYYNRLDIPMHPIHVNGFQTIRNGGHYPLLRKHFHHAVGSARG